MEWLAGVELYDVWVTWYCFPNAGLIHYKLSGLLGLNAHLLESVVFLAITNSVDEAETAFCDKGLNLVVFAANFELVSDQVLAFNHFIENL